MTVISAVGVAVLLGLLSGTGPQDWVVRYREAGVRTSRPRAVMPCPGGGLAVAGTTCRDSTYHDALLVRYDADGNELWHHRYDWRRDDDFSRGLAVAPGGRLVACVAGSQGVPSSAAKDFVFVSYEPDGRIAWVTTWEDNPDEDYNDEPHALAMDADGNVAACGTSRWVWGIDKEYMVTVLVDTAGAVRWVARCTTAGFGRAVCADSAGAWYAAGLRDRYGGTVEKYTPDGTLVWTSRHIGRYPDVGGLVVARDGSVYVGGIDVDRVVDYWLARLDPDGNLLWERTYDGAGGYDEVTHLAVDEAGNSYLAGRSAGDSTGFDICTVSWDRNGNRRWVARYGTRQGDGAGGIFYDGEWVYVVGHVWVVGSWYQTDAVILRYGPDDGVLKWSAVYGGPAQKGDYYRCVTVVDGHVYAAGYVSYDTLVVVRYNPDGLALEESPPVPAGAAAVPTICRGGVLVTDHSAAVLLDLTGRRVADLHRGANDVRQLSPGVYFVRETGPSGQGSEGISRRVVVLE